MSLESKLKAGLIKGALIGAVGAGISIVFLDGMKGVPLTGIGAEVPKFAVTAGCLVGASLASDAILPFMLPYVSGSVPVLRNFENLVMQPLICSAVVTVVEAVIAPELVSETNTSMFKVVMINAVAPIGGAYIANAMGWIENVTSF